MSLIRHISCFLDDYSCKYIAAQFFLGVIVKLLPMGNFLTEFLFSLALMLGTDVFWNEYTLF